MKADALARRPGHPIGRLYVVDLEGLVSKLLEVVRQTVQPDVVTVWLRAGSEWRPSYSQP